MKRSIAISAAVLALMMSPPAAISCVGVQASARKPAKAAADETLLGSSKLESTYEIGGNTVQLGDIVAGAHADFGGSVAEWNALPEDDREARLQTKLEQLRTAAPPAATDQPSNSDRVAELANDKAKAAEAATAKAADEGRLPETSAITNPAPATQMESPSGAFIEDEIKGAIPVDHPAVDNNPRAGTSAVQNGADFNDPFMNDPNSPDFVGQGIDKSVYGKVEADKK